MKKIIQISALVMMILAGMLFTWHLWPDSYSYEINLDGVFAPCELRVKAKAGVVIFEMPENSGFLVASFSQQEGPVAPWGNVVYITVTTPNKVTRKLSSPLCLADIPYDGELIIRVEQNPEYAPVIQKVSTGIAPSPLPSDFEKGAITLKIRNVKDPNPNIPELKDLPKKTDKWQGVLKFFKEKSTKEPSEYGLWITPFNPKEIKVVKSAFDEARETAKKVKKMLGGAEK